jgi:hypothetical protein
MVNEEKCKITDIRTKTELSAESFRLIWIELAELITNIAYNGYYRDFGYDDFETYFKEELKLDKNIVKKLLLSAKKEVKND